MKKIILCFFLFLLISGATGSSDSVNKDKNDFQEKVDYDKGTTWFDANYFFTCVPVNYPYYVIYIRYYPLSKDLIAECHSNDLIKLDQSIMYTITDEQANKVALLLFDKNIIETTHVLWQDKPVFHFNYSNKDIYFRRTAILY